MGKTQEERELYRIKINLFGTVPAYTKFEKEWKQTTENLRKQRGIENGKRTEK